MKNQLLEKAIIGLYKRETRNNATLKNNTLTFFSDNGKVIFKSKGLTRDCQSFVIKEVGKAVYDFIDMNEPETVN